MLGAHVADHAGAGPGLTQGTVRAVAPTGDVDLTVVDYSQPYLSGRFRGGPGRVHIALAEQAGVYVRACASPPGAAVRRRPSSTDLNTLLGCVVEFSDQQGAVALSVEGVSGPGEVVGRTRLDSCGSKPRPCLGGLVRIDVRDGTRVDERRLDQGRSVLKTAGVVALGALTVLGELTGLYILGCYTSGCD